MKKFSVKLVCAAVFIAVSLSHAITAIPISGIKASATLPDVGQNNFRPENMVMKNYVHPFYQVWGAKYNGKPITLEFLVEAQRLDQITLFNGFMRDSASYVNNSLAKTIKIYLNTTDNLVKVATLAKPKWHGYKKPHADIILFEKPLKNVFKIIIEIEDIYPGKLYPNACIALVKFWGFPKLPRKPRIGQITDERDGEKYKTVDVGEDIWMAQDLRYKTPGSRTFTDPAAKNLKIPSDAGLEYPESDLDKICPDGWRLPKAAEIEKLKTELPKDASYDDLFSTAYRRPLYSIQTIGKLSGSKDYSTDTEVFFYPTNATGLNISTLTRRYYGGECTEETGETFAFGSYWTKDTKDIPLWPDEEGNVEIKHLRHYRFGGTDYCEAMLCREDYHFVRCIMGRDEEPEPVNADSTDVVPADSAATDSAVAPANQAEADSVTSR